MLSEISLSHRKTQTVGFHLREVSSQVHRDRGRVAAASAGEGEKGTALDWVQNLSLARQSPRGRLHSNVNALDPTQPRT